MAFMNSIYVNERTHRDSHLVRRASLLGCIQFMWQLHSTQNIERYHRHCKQLDQQLEKLRLFV